MIMQDKLEKERNDAKNAVEEYVYEFRDKLCGPYEKFICEQVCLEPGFYSDRKNLISNSKFEPLLDYVVSFSETKQVEIEIV